MGTKYQQTHDARGIQVFELTMDNPEDQDELNRQLQRPGESNHRAATGPARNGQGESRTDSARTKTQTP